MAFDIKADKRTVLFFSVVLDRYLLRSFKISQYTPDVSNLPHFKETGWGE